MQRIKPEPMALDGTASDRPVNGSITVRSISNQNGSRFARSGAPSVDTRAAQQVPRPAETASEDEEEEPVLLEVKRRGSRLRTLGSSIDRMSGGATAAANMSFVSHGFTSIGDKVKELNDTLGEFQSLGIQHVTNLPELVLVGDQSAGKSSLMSSFSGLYLPRSEGACTRCPVHIRLSGSHDESWSCRISLQQDYEYRPPAPVTRANPFGPWFEQRRHVREFARLSDPSAIEETLRWAQIATLNPSKEHTLYKPEVGELWRRAQRLGADVQRNEAAFSPNTVALDITAPGMADLSFYDLPGVFTSAKRDEDQYLVKVVENLTAKYISHQQAIILWAVPMNADPETSSTFSIIRAQHAQARTIGIMTKADLLPPGVHASAQWMAMLSGEQHRVGHGYFITARPVVTQDLIPDDMLPQRDPSRPADDLERQGAFEEAFFNKQLRGMAGQEWRGCFQDFEDRCGVARLVAFMSQQLGAEFAKCLPQIKEKVTDKLLDVNDELALLPDLPENPELEVRRSLADFASRARSIAEDVSLSPPLGSIVHQFRADIRHLKPRYIVRVESTPVLHTDAAGRIDLTRDDDSVSVQSSASPSLAAAARRRRLDEHLDGLPDALAPVTPSKRLRTTAASAAATDVGIKTETRSDAGGSVARLALRSDIVRPKSKSLLEVRGIIASKSKPGMPGIVTEEVYNALCMEAVRPWKGPLQHLVDRIYRLIDSMLSNLLYTSLSRLRERLVFKKASAILKKLVVDRVQARQAVLMQHYELETRKFYTLDEDSLLRHEQAEAKELGRHRHHYRMLAYLGDRAADRPPPRPLDTMAEEERVREEARISQEATKLGPDPFKIELGVCAYVRGYYLTASTRFVDMCTLHIVSGLVPDIIDTLSKLHIDQELGICNGSSTPQDFLDLMEEDKSTSDRRDGLKEDRRRYQRTIESIERLESSSQFSQNHLAV